MHILTSRMPEYLGFKHEIQLTLIEVSWNTFSQCVLISSFLSIFKMLEKTMLSVLENNLMLSYLAFGTITRVTRRCHLELNGVNLGYTL